MSDPVVDEEWLHSVLTAQADSGGGWTLGHDEVCFLLGTWNRNRRAKLVLSSMIRSGVAPDGFDDLQGALYD